MQDLIDFIKDIKLINQMRHKIQKKKFIESLWIELITETIAQCIFKNRKTLTFWLKL